MKRQFLTLLLLLPLHFVAQAQAGFNKAKLDSLLTVLESKNKLMGAVALYQNGKPLYSRAIGYATSRGNDKIKATTATKYRVGSISKIFTATLVMQLVEQKKLSLDTPLSVFFPQFENASSITIEHLLHHRSGLKNFTAEPAYATYLHQPKTQAELLSIMSALKPGFQPGQKFEYSNTNYVLLSYIVEKVTQQPYAHVLKKCIADKLGLKSTFYGGKINSARQEASSFRWNQEQWQEEPETDMSIPQGAGGIVSTPNDLALFIQGLFNHTLISEASLQKMMAFQDKYGLGMMEFALGNSKGYGHGGGIDGFSSMVTYFPQEKLALATTFNGVATNANDVLIGILSIAMGKPYTIPTYETPKDLRLDLTRYEGVFASKQFPLKITMKKEGEKLLTQATGQSAFYLEARSEKDFVFEPAGIQIEFRKSEAGVYDTFVLKQGGGQFLFEKE